jgi:uncharacterized protein with HEPN domain
MSRDPQILQDYLMHIHLAIKRIEEYCSDIDELGFLNSQLIQDAVIRNFEVIGEASKNIERHFPEFSANHPDLPLGIAYEMRNALAHGYFKVDLPIVWKTIEINLPAMDRLVLSLIGNLPSNK